MAYQVPDARRQIVKSLNGNTSEATKVLLGTSMDVVDHRIPAVASRKCNKEESCSSP